MGRFVVVDGHSVLFGIERFRVLLEVNQSAARDALIRRLEEHQAFGGERLVVVFDGKGRLTSEDSQGGVQVIFAPSADSAIERLVARYGGVHALTVVSNDVMERLTVTAFGAATMSVTDFERELDRSERLIAREIRRRGPSGRYR